MYGYVNDTLATVSINEENYRRISKIRSMMLSKMRKDVKEKWGMVDPYYCLC